MGWDPSFGSLWRLLVLASCTAAAAGPQDARDIRESAGHVLRSTHAVFLTDGKFDDMISLRFAAEAYDEVDVVTVSNRNPGRAAGHMAEFLHDTGVGPRGARFRFWAGRDALHKPPEETHEKYYVEPSGQAADRFGLEMVGGEVRLPALARLASDLRGSTVNVHHVGPTAEEDLEVITSKHGGIDVAMFHTVQGFNSKVGGSTRSGAKSLKEFWQRFLVQLTKDHDNVFVLATNSILSWEDQRGNPLPLDIFRNHVPDRWLRFALESNTFVARRLGEWERQYGPLRAVVKAERGIDWPQLVPTGRRTPPNLPPSASPKDAARWGVENLQGLVVKASYEEELRTHFLGYLQKLELIVAMQADGTLVELIKEKQAAGGLREISPETYARRGDDVDDVMDRKNQGVRRNLQPVAVATAELCDFNHIISLFHLLESIKLGKVPDVASRILPAYWGDEPAGKGGIRLYKPGAWDEVPMVPIRGGSAEDEQGGRRMMQLTRAGFVPTGFTYSESRELAKEFVHSKLKPQTTISSASTVT